MSPSVRFVCRCLMLVLALGGCTFASDTPSDAGEGIGQVVHDCPVVSEPKGMLSGASVRRAVAIDEGHLTMVDLSGQPIGARGPRLPGRVVDLAYDPWKRRVWALSEAEEGQSSELFSVTINDEVLLPTEEAESSGGAVAFGTARWRASIDGRARMLVVQRGILLFERGQGTRWRLLPREQGFAPSQPAPIPVGAWPLLADPRAQAVGVAVASAHSLWVGQARLLSDRPAEHRWQLREREVPLGTEISLVGAQAAFAPSAGLVVATADGRDVRLVRIGGAENVSAPLRIDLGQFGSQSAGTWVQLQIGSPGPDAPDDCRARVAAVSREPAGLFVADVSMDEEEEPRACRAGWTPLPSQPAFDPRAPGRRLVVGAERVLVATDAGLVPIAVQIEGGRLALHPGLPLRTEGPLEPISGSVVSP